MKTALGRGYFNLFLCGMFLIQFNDPSKTVGIWSLINCIAFGACGLFFIVVSYCYPEMAVKEIDSAKLKANVDSAVTGKGEQQNPFIDGANNQAPEPTQTKSLGQYDQQYDYQPAAAPAYN